MPLVSCNAQWMLNTPVLAKDYFLVMVELWGHGASPLPEDESDCSMAGYIDCFERIRRQLNIKRWALIGQSYGAGLALGYAHRHAAHCTGVIVTNSRSAFGQVSATAGARAESRNSMQAPGFNPRKLPYHPIHSRRFPARVKAALVQSADAMTRQAVALSARLASELNGTHLLGTLQCPLLIANGRYEKSFQADLQALIARHPHLEVVHLGAGHSVNIEAAAQFNDAVKRFLSSL